MLGYDTTGATAGPSTAATSGSLKRKAELLSKPSPPQSKSIRKGYVKEHKLCETCEEIDFLAFFTSKPPAPVHLGNIEDDSWSSTCPFCSYVHAVAMVRWNTEPCCDQMQRAMLTLEHVKVSGEERLRTSDLTPIYRLDLLACRKNAKRVTNKARITSFDLVGSHPRPKFGNNTFQVSRKPRELSFHIDLLRSWLDHNHESGKGRRVAKRATAKESVGHLIKQQRFRVLDVHACEVVALRESEEYVALSYLWGNVNILASVQHLDKPYCRTGNHVEVVWTVNPEKMPKTIHDAAVCVRKLGERYLWVESLCIDRGSDTDKQYLISEMRSIYWAALFTIVAAEGVDANAGLGRLQRCSEVLDEQIVFVRHDTTIRLLPSLPGLEEVLTGTKWNTRGWTYQERMLSFACVYFTSGQVFFTGPGMTKREAYVLERNPAPDTTRKKKSRTTGRRVTTRDILSGPKLRSGFEFEQYCKIVEAYTSKELGYKGDRLNALSGVLDILTNPSQMREESALSGLVKMEWGERRHQWFERSLLWQPRYGAVTNKDRIETNTAGMRALPSRSWAGWSCEVSFPYREPHTRMPDYCELRAYIIDATNIQCIVESEYPLDNWPTVPQPCKISITQGIVLHLWRPVLRCTLDDHVEQRAEPPSESFSTCRILWHLPGHHSQDMGIIDVAPEFTPLHNNNVLYDFVHLGFADLQIQALTLVKKHGDYFRRVALARVNVHALSRLPRSDGDGWSKLQATRRRIYDTCNWQHVKLV